MKWHKVPEIKLMLKYKINILFYCPLYVNALILDCHLNQIQKKY